MLSRYFLFYVVIMLLSIGNVIETKKKHPCGGNAFIILRLGSDLKIRCRTCQKELTVSRIKIEKMIRNVYAGKTEAD